MLSQICENWSQYMVISKFCVLKDFEGSQGVRNSESKSPVQLNFTNIKFPPKISVSTEPQSKFKGVIRFCVILTKSDS